MFYNGWHIEQQLLSAVCCHAQHLGLNINGSKRIVIGMVMPGPNDSGQTWGRAPLRCISSFIHIAGEGRVLENVLKSLELACLEDIGAPRVGWQGMQEPGTATGSCGGIDA